MPKYIAVLHQPGGCDYTIACGTRVEHLQATTFEEAQAEAEALLTEYDGEQSLDALTVYEVTCREAINVREIYARIDREIAAVEIARREAIEREQLVKLQAKYGKP